MEVRQIARIKEIKQNILNLMICQGQNLKEALGNKKKVFLVINLRMFVT